MVKPSSSAVLPFLRSDVVGAILAELFLDTEAEFSISELARRTGANIATVHRETTNLVQAGVLLDRREGGSRLVRANPSYAYFGPLREIIISAFGPEPVLRELLRNYETIKEAYIYGSWAARRSGFSGATPNDIDVLVVGELSIPAVMEIRENASQILRSEVNVQRTDSATWHDVESGFYGTIKSRPLVTLIGADDGSK